MQKITKKVLLLKFLKLHRNKRMILHFQCYYCENKQVTNPKKGLDVIECFEKVI